jgi:hypothetical protein
MSEQQEQSNAEAQEVLQRSELTARLLRRLTVSPGVIDAQMLRQFAARLAGGITRTLSLLDDLMARYGVDDHLTIESPPLLMEQPWMVNINAYLTNYNSYSSTTNQFISSAVTSQAHSSTSHSSTFLLTNSLSTEQTSSQPSQSSTDSINSSVRAPGHAANSRPESFDTIRHVQRHEARSVLDERASLPLPAGKFRVSRSPARRGRGKPSAEAQDVMRNPAPKSSEDSNASTPNAAASTIQATAPRIALGKIEEGQIESAKAIASNNALADTAPAELLLARTRIAQSQIQRQSLDENANVSQPTAAKIREVRGMPQPTEARQTHAPAVASVAPELVEPPGETKTAGSSSPTRERESVTRQTSEAGLKTQTAKPAAQTRTSTTTLPLVQKLSASLPIQKRPPDFIWRQGADSSTMKDFASTVLNADSLQSLNRVAGGASSVQQQNSQTFTPEAERRKDGTQAGSGISAERILRNISRKLLIERERRGY